MKPLIVLLVTYFISLLATRIISGDYNYLLSGNIAMSVMLLFTAMGHFIYTKGMMLMMPAFIPYKKELVYFTGIIEIAAAIGLLIPGLRHLTAVLLIIFFILVLSANVNAAINKVDYEKASYNGPGIRYLWFRVPLQLFFIAWVTYFAL
jgi:uncharacterized membrane protein